MAIPNKFEKIRYEIERQFKMYAKESEGSDKAEFWRDAASVVNDVFDPVVSPLLQCAMCGAMDAFEIDSENPSDGYCYAEDTVWSLKPGKALQKCACGHNRFNHGLGFCGIPECGCQQFKAA